MATTWAAGSPTRERRQQTLSIILFASSLTTVGVLATTAVFAGYGVLSQLPLMSRIVGLTFLIFFVPTLLMGMVSPVVIKLTLANLRTTGNTVGTVYAFSTAGSIVGTFLTGFLLIELMGVRAIVISVGVVLLLLAVVSRRLWRSEVTAAGT